MKIYIIESKLYYDIEFKAPKAVKKSKIKIYKFPK